MMYGDSSAIILLVYYRDSFNIGQILFAFRFFCFCEGSMAFCGAVTCYLVIFMPKD